MKYTLIQGNSKEKLKELAENSVDSVVTDPPYELNFCGKAWDRTGIANDVELWKEVYRVLKPGGHLLAFSGSRTYHRMTCAIEDAGFEVRDQIMWVYGCGFTKSYNLSKAMDREAGVRGFEGKGQVFGVGNKVPSRFHVPYTAPEPITEAAKKWAGWGTAIKPAHEPICVARKPISENTVAANQIKWGVGGMNVEACRVGEEVMAVRESTGEYVEGLDRSMGKNTSKEVVGEAVGRIPANFIHDGSEEVVGLFPTTSSGKGSFKAGDYGQAGVTGFSRGDFQGYGDKGSAARFFYSAKCGKKDRDEGIGGDAKAVEQHFLDGSEVRGTAYKNPHPTVKPTEVMEWLIKLVTPKGGVVLDPFNG